MRILVVEDEVKIRRGIANLIERHTKHVVVGEAKNGREGLEMVMKHQPDLVIADIRMPVMNGLEMIRALHEQEAPQHVVILSGYSEFEYAKQAIRYGVDDYLIKPLAPEDVTRLLEAVQEKITKELHKQQVTPEKRLKDFLTEHVAEGKEDELKLLCGFTDDGSYRLLSAYCSSAVQDEREKCTLRFEKLKAKFPDQKFYFFFMESSREFLCIMEDNLWELVREELEWKLLRNVLRNCDWVWTVSQPSSFRELTEQYNRAKDQYLYGMVLGYDTFISREQIDHFVPETYSYPKTWEYQMQAAVYSGKKEKVYGSGQQFMEAMARLKVKPDQTKESYMKMANFLMNLTHESNRQVYEQLLGRNLMKNIGLAVTRRELEGILKEEIHVLTLGMDRKEDISNYTIKKAINYIRNHYQESMSLEYVAKSLDITPEYLSTLFNREMGENFSVFLKKFRISHAKRLLNETNKKVYEIAHEVGYTDPKYFSRVFKEEEGVSPGDYRSLH